jgi:hypothetical protein
MLLAPRPVERRRRAVRFARLIHRRVRVPGGPAARTACGGTLKPALVAAWRGAADRIVTTARASNPLLFQEIAAAILTRDLRGLRFAQRSGGHVLVTLLDVATSTEAWLKRCWMRADRTSRLLEAGRV